MVMESVIAGSLITHPNVYLVGQTGMNESVIQSFLDDHAVTWEKDGTEDTELLSELAGRVCYMSFGAKQGRKSTREYLENIIDLGHGSVLEHVVWTFIIEGVSRSFSHELVRHRAGTAFSQLSQRYVDAAETRFVIPPLLQEVFHSQDERDEDTFVEWTRAIERCRITYAFIVESLERYVTEYHPEKSAKQRRKMAREAARSVLPNATETIMVFSANARALRHIIEYRGSVDAEPEIRGVANELLLIMRGVAPTLFGDYNVIDDVITTRHDKV